MKKWFFLFFLIMIDFSLNAQVDLSGAVTSISTIGAQVSGVLGAVIGLIGIGGAAFKFVHGDHDATKFLLTAIVGVALGQVAASFF